MLLANIEIHTFFCTGKKLILLKLQRNTSTTHGKSVPS
jgi:hypothetical protein